jgi:hypothetical protein
MFSLSVSQTYTFYVFLYQLKYMFKLILVFVLFLVGGTVLGIERQFVCLCCWVCGAGDQT